MKNFKIEIKWALVFTGMMLAWMLMERLAGLHDKHIAQHATISGFVAIPAIAIYVFALLDKRRNFYGGFMTYKQGFMTGFFITLFVTLLTPLVQYLTSTVIAPDYFTNIKAFTVGQNIMTAEEADAAFNLKTYLWQATLGAFGMGLLTAAVVAIFTRKKPVVPQTEFAHS